MKRIKKIAMMLCCFFMLCTATMHTAAAEIPDPTDEFYVNDYADILDTASKDHIISVNNRLYREYDVQLVVVTVEDLSGQDLESYAYDVFNSWGIGSKKTNRGILLVLAKREDDYWITQGKGLEKLMPSDMLSDLLNENLEADFEKKDYSAGVTKTIDALEKKIKTVVPAVKNENDKDKDSTAASTTASEPNEGNDMSIFDVIIVLVVVGGGIFAFRQYRKKHPKQPKQPREPKEVRRREPREHTGRYADFYFTNERYYNNPRYYNDPAFYNDPRYYRNRHLYHHHHHDDRHHHDERYHDHENRYDEHRQSRKPSSSQSSTSRPSNPSPAPNRGQGGSTNGGGAGRRKG